MVMKMTTGLAVGIGVGPFATKQPEGSSSALDVITSSNGAWWVVKERDGSNNLVDQTGGGRHLLLPGGSANPVLLDHTGTDYFWFPGTASNTLTTGGLSNSTAYDYKVWYLDGSTATGEETTDGSGVLTLGGTQTNFNVKKVTRIRVVADGADPDAATAVRDILASDADPDATTFTEASSNAATVTINRSSTGYRTEVVDQPKYVSATDDYLVTSGAGSFFAVDSSDATVIFVGAIRGAMTGSFDMLLTNTISAGDGWQIRRQIGGSGFLVRCIYVGASATAVDEIDLTAAGTYAIALRLDRTAGELEAFVNGVGTGSPAAAGGVGGQVQEDNVGVFAQSDGGNRSDSVFIAGAFIKEALTTEQISAIGDALITANGGTP